MMVFSHAVWCGVLWLLCVLLLRVFVLILVCWCAVGCLGQHGCSG